MQTLYASCTFIPDQFLRPLKNYKNLHFCTAWFQEGSNLSRASKCKKRKKKKKKWEQETRHFEHIIYWKQQFNWNSCVCAFFFFFFSFFDVLLDVHILTRRCLLQSLSSISERESKQFRVGAATRTPARWEWAWAGRGHWRQTDREDRLTCCWSYGRRPGPRRGAPPLTWKRRRRTCSSPINANWWRALLLPLPPPSRMRLERSERACPTYAGFVAFWASALRPLRCCQGGSEPGAPVPGCDAGTRDSWSSIHSPLGSTPRRDTPGRMCVSSPAACARVGPGRSGCNISCTHVPPQKTSRSRLFQRKSWRWVRLVRFGHFRHIASNRTVIWHFHLIKSHFMLVALASCGCCVAIGGLWCHGSGPQLVTPQTLLSTSEVHFLTMP